jgi:hypothetical protein
MLAERWHLGKCFLPRKRREALQGKEDERKMKGR